MLLGDEQRLGVLLCGGGGHQPADHVHGALVQGAGRVARGVALDAPVGRVGCPGVEPGDLERAGVDPGHVVRAARQEHRPVGDDAVEVLGRGHATGEVRLVPAAAGDPRGVRPGGGVLRDAPQAVVAPGGPAEVAAHAFETALHGVDVRVGEARQQQAIAEVDHLGTGTGGVEGVRAQRDDASGADRDGADVTRPAEQHARAQQALRRRHQRPSSNGPAGSWRRPFLRAAIALSDSSTTRLPRAAVMSAWSYGGDTSTTSTPTTGSSRQTRRTASSSCRADRPPGLGGPGAGRVAGVADVDVDGQEHPVAVVGRDRERLGQARVQAAGDDLGHLVGPHALLGHPRQRRGLRPVATQPDLQEPVAAQRTGLDQPSHRLAMPPQRAERDVAGVGVRVEVHHRDATLSVHPGDPFRVRQRDRVVAPEYDRHRPGLGHCGHGVLQVGDRALDLAGVHLHVAGVAYHQVLQRVDPQRQVRAGPVVWQVVGLPDGRGAEAGTRAVRRAPVEGCAHDHDIGSGQGVRVGEVTAGHAEKRDVRTELGSVAAHVALQS